MTKPITHDTFTIERTFRANRDRAFQAWSDIRLKEKWFAGPAGRWSIVKRELDFSVGGSEVAVGRFSDGDTSGFYATYQDIIPNERIVYSYRMYVNDTLLSVSLATVEFFDEGTGSKTIFTEQGVYFTDSDAAVSRRQGSEMLMDKFVNSLEMN